MKNLILFLIPIFILVACSPNAKKKLPLKPAKHGNVYVVAHRGAHNSIPENSIPAYLKAIELGCDFVEIDVRTTKDSQFVSIHNSTIDNYVEGKTGKVKDFTLAEMRALDIGSRIGPEWQGTQIPTFDEILDLCKGKIGIYLDLKDAPVKPLIEKIKKHGMEHDVLWYADDDELEQVKKICPECIIMPDPGAESKLPRLIERFNPDVIAAVWRHYSKSFVEKCHQAGAIVIVDESNPDCWEQALKWESDGIQTNFPGKLIEFLKKK